MLKKIAATTALASVVLLSGCATGYSPVGVGLITDVKGPITATELNGNKTGTACAKTIIGIINSGDASIQPLKQMVASKILPLLTTTLKVSTLSLVQPALT